MDVFTALNVKGPLTVSTAGNASYELQVTSSTLSTTKIIEQTGTQGTDANNLVKVGTFAPITGTTNPTSGDVTIAGQIYINTNTSTSYIYTGSEFVPLGDPSHENVIEHIYAGSSEVLPDSNKTVTLGTAAVSTASTHAINSTNAGSSASTKDELATIGQVYTALTDGTVTKIGYTNYATDDLGGALRPIYLKNGVPTAGTQLYNKNISLNGSTNNHNVISQNNSFSLSFYAPTGPGSTGQILRATGSAPGWESPATTLDTTASGYNGDLIPTSSVVNAGISAAIAAIPTPMRFMGTIGSGGTIGWSQLPTASSAEGETYKVISAHTSAPVCEEGDTIISNGSSWIVIPSGDEPDGTVKNVATGTGLTGGPITTTGTISIATANLLYREAFQVSAASSIDCMLDSNIWTGGVVPRIVQIYTHTSKDLIMGDVDLSSTGHVYISFATVPSEQIDVNVIGW